MFLYLKSNYFRILIASHLWSMHIYDVIMMFSLFFFFNLIKPMDLFWLFFHPILTLSVICNWTDAGWHGLYLRPWFISCLVLYGLFTATTSFLLSLQLPLEDCKDSSNTKVDYWKSSKTLQCNSVCQSLPGVPKTHNIT